MELVIAMAMLTIIFAVVVPQFVIIRNSWDLKQGSAEALQNGRVLIDHINRNLIKAKRITAVGASSIEFTDYNNVDWEYNIGAGYVQFGQPGNLEDLAGPVGSLTFTCYDACDLDNPLSPVTDTNEVRVVKVDAVFINSGSLGRDETFTTWVYLRVNSQSAPELPEGLVGWWKLDETSGTTAADCSCSGNDGTLVNMSSPACWVTGQIEGALELDGSNDYVNCGNDNSLNITGDITMALWLRADSFSNEPDITTNGAYNVSYSVWLNSSGRIVFAINNDRLTSSSALSTSTWYHIAATRSGSTRKVYINGQEDNSDTYGSAIGTTSSPFTISTTGYPFNGGVDDVRVYNRALNDEEVAELASILRYQDFNEDKVGYDAASITISTPPSNTNDLLIAAVATDGGITISPQIPGNWTLINHGSDSGNQVTLGVWRRLALAPASEPTSHTFTWTGGNEQAYGWIMRFTGHDASNPINTSQSASSSGTSTPVSPAVTTTVNNCLILRLGAFDDDDVNTLPEPGNPGLSGHTAITMDKSGTTVVPTTPTFQAAGTAQSGTGAITVPWPTHQADDVALLFVESCGGQAVTLSTPAGFANVTNSPQATGSGVNGTRITVFWCRATSSSMSSPVVQDPGNHVYGRILTFRGVIPTGNPWDVTAGGIKATASTTTTFGAVTTTVDNELIVLAASRDNDSAAVAWSAWTNSNLSSLTERSDGGTTSGNGGGIGVATGAKLTAGSTGSTTATVTSSADGHMTIALRPPAAVTGTVSGGAGYVRQSATGSSGTSTFTLTASNEARMLTIAIAPAGGGSTGCCGDYIRP